MNSLRVSPSQLSDLQCSASRVRNICIIAHIDHGKTTLADNIICSNGIISQKMAGKLRFLDSTDDEQKRGITMYSSAISLLYSMEPMVSMLHQASPAATEAKRDKDEYLVNLVDSPGHIDFSSDVSTATRLCDGALLVVDVLEGICPQTHAVLYKALKDRMHPCLVLNKIDKLILELNMSPTEAFNHLRRLIERVNALASTLLNSELRARDEDELAAPVGDSAAEEDPLVEIWDFAPEKGNVVFASAIDGWGFGIGRFALFWAKQLSLNKHVVQKHMFDDYAFNKTTKKIVKVDPSNTNAKPMFVTMVLEPIWQMYEVAIAQQNGEKAAKMAKRLGVQIAKRDIYMGASSSGGGSKSQTGATSTSSASNEAYRGTLQAIMRAWLPLADAVLRTVVRIVPDPVVSQRLKMRAITRQREITDTISRVSDDVAHCRPGAQRDSDVNTVVFIAKMVPVRIADLSPKDAEAAILSVRSARDRASNSTDEGEDSTSNSYDHSVENINNTEVFLALGRVFSGTLSADSGGSVYCLGNHHNPFEYEKPQEEESVEENDCGVVVGGGSSRAQAVPLSELSFYMCLGPSVLPVESVPAGNIVCIFGLQDYVLKSSTICSSPLSLPMKAITFQTKPMLRVAVEPKNHYNLRDLETGLQQLYQYDPVVEIGVDDLGQSTITCLGELHLELCLKALSEKFAKCEVVASAPLVPFRETVVTAPVLGPVAQSHLATSSASPLAGLESLLPPPWKDLSGIGQVQRVVDNSGIHSSLSVHEDGRAALNCGGMHRLVVTSQLVSLTFRCLSLPTAAAKFLNPDVDEAKSLSAHVISDFIASHKRSSADSGVGLGGVDSEDGMRNMRQAWDQFADTILLRDGDAAEEDTVDHCLLDDADRVRQKSDRAGDQECPPPLSSLLSRMVSLGPHGAGPNMLLFSPDVTLELYEQTVPPVHEGSTGAQSNSADESIHCRGEVKFQQDDPCCKGSTQAESKIMAVLTQKSSAELARTTSEDSAGRRDVFQHVWSRLRGSVVSGFQMLTASGPLMQEPLQGVCFSIEKVEISARVAGLEEEELRTVAAWHGERASSTGGVDGEEPEEEKVSQQAMMFSTGQLISDVRDSLRLCMLGCALRLVEPIYKCSLQCDQLQLGGLYGVLSRRRGEVTDEDIIEGTSLFVLTVSLPVANSFGFAQELLQKTSGSGTAPQLFFSHWYVNDLDPFWKPTTSEEQEEHGTDGSVEHNLSRSFIDGVRRRKGLVVEEKLVASAEKQRTLTKNK